MYKNLPMPISNVPSSISKLFSAPILKLNQPSQIQRDVRQWNKWINSLKYWLEHWWHKTLYFCVCVRACVPMNFNQLKFHLKFTCKKKTVIPLKVIVDSQNIISILHRTDMSYDNVQHNSMCVCQEYLHQPYLYANVKHWNQLLNRVCWCVSQQN